LDFDPRDDESAGVRLLADIHAVFDAPAVDRISSAALAEGLCSPFCREGLGVKGTRALADAYTPGAGRLCRS
jgi:hypothetical protein